MATTSLEASAEQGEDEDADRRMRGANRDPAGPRTGTTTARGGRQNFTWRWGDRWGVVVVMGAYVALAVGRPLRCLTPAALREEHGARER